MFLRDAGIKLPPRHENGFKDPNLTFTIHCPLPEISGQGFILTNHSKVAHMLCCSFKLIICVYIKWSNMSNAFKNKNQAPVKELKSTPY